MPSKSETTQQEYLVKVSRKRAEAYLNLPGVTSVGVGYKIKDGQETDTLCIQYTVEKKRLPSSLENAGERLLPAVIKGFDNDDIPVDVLERRYGINYTVLPESGAMPEALPPDDRVRRSRQPVLRPGISVSNVKVSAGTIGAIVFDRATREPMILSNWHVLVGDQGRAGDTVVQPGTADNPDIGRNTCGKLVRSHLGLAGDCAVATIKGRRFDPAILGLNVAPRQVAKVHLRDHVVKSGRTTGITHGVVRRIGVTTKIHYGAQAGVRSIGGFEIGPDSDFPAAAGEISMGGDSGSLWLIYDPRGKKVTDIAVGLHFAGESDPNPSAEHAIACNIHSVLDKLNIQFSDPKPQHLSEEELFNHMLERLARVERQVAARPAPGAGKAALQSTLENGVPVYGNWCGPGHGGGPAVDDLDAACRDHDQCYDDRGYFDCGCDKTLLQKVAEVMANGQVSEEGRRIAPLIAAYFSTATCANHPLGKGLPVPGNQPVNMAIDTVRKVADGAWNIVKGWKL